MKDVIFGFLAKTLNKSHEQLADLLYQKSDDANADPVLKTDALQVLLDLDAKRVSDLKPDTKDIFNNGYKKAQAEVAESWEADIRDVFKIDQEAKLKGAELLGAVKAATAGKSKDPAAIKTSAEYLELERESKKALDALAAKHREELEAIDSKYKKESTWQNVQGEIRKHLMELNPVLPEDTGKRERLLELFAGMFSGYDWQADNGTFIPMKDGNRVENAQKYPKSLADLVKEGAESMFDFAKQPPAGNAGNKNGKDSGSGSGTTVTTRFKDESDYLKQYAEETDPAKKTALYDAYKAQTAEGGGE